MTGTDDGARGGGLDAGEVWDRFCRELAEAGRLLLTNPEVTTERERAETLRYVARELKGLLEGAFETSNPDFPQLLRMDDTCSGPTAPNLDNWYLSAHLRPGSTYVLRGDVSDVFDVNLSIHDAGLRSVLAERYKADLCHDADGTFEVVIGPPSDPTVTLPVGDAAAMLMMRVYFYDWDRETPPWFQLTRVSSELSSPEPLSLAQVDEALRGVSAAYLRRSQGWTSFLLDYFRRTPVNVLGPSEVLPGGGRVISIGGGVHQLEHEQALVIEFEPPDARYWSFNLYTIPWWEPIDVTNHVTTLNGRQVHVDDDGRVRIVVAHRDPGVQNWLDPAGARQGAIFYRWIWSEDAPVPTTTLTTIDRLPDELPATTPVFGPEDRREQIARRRAHLARRFRR
jgi:hypothetical protein